MNRFTRAVGLATVAGVAAVTLPATAAQAAWSDQMSQRDMIANWCNYHEHKAYSWGNWQDGYYCQQPGYAAVRQSASPGGMCRWIFADSSISFHVVPGTKDGACAYWV